MSELDDEISLPAINVPPLPKVDEQMSDAEINRVHLQMSNMEIICCITCGLKLTL
jgi:hypothetical protein